MRTQGATTTADAPQIWAAGPLEAPIGWLLCIGGVCAGLVWAAAALLGGPPASATTVDAVFGAGVQHGTTTALLPLVAVGSVLAGVGVLRGGSAGVDPRLLWAVYGTAALGWLTSGRPVLAGLSALALLVLLALRRRLVRR